MTGDKERRWMILPKNAAYPNFNGVHREDDWCPKAGCVPVDYECVTAGYASTRCCDNGNFGDGHKCMKSNPEAAESPKVTEEAPPGVQFYVTRRTVKQAFRLSDDPTPAENDMLHEFLSSAKWESDRDSGLTIHTLEGPMRADSGDYIIKGLRGEFYPCKPDIFALNYEPFEPSKSPVTLSPTLDEDQRKLVAWGTECFGADHMADHKVRALRLLEEAIELSQAVSVPAEQCAKLVEYVYSRPAGNPQQELGGVGVTWLVAAAALGSSALEALHAEMERIAKKPPAHFAQRNQQKLDAGFNSQATQTRSEGTLSPTCAMCGSNMTKEELGWYCNSCQPRRWMPENKSGGGTVSAPNGINVPNSVITNAAQRPFESPDVPTDAVQRVTLSAQEFYDSNLTFPKIHEADKRTVFQLMDALSAHNTAELLKQIAELERQYTEKTDQCIRWADRDYQFNRAESAEAALEAKTRELEGMRTAEHDLSDAYLTIRGIVGAWDTPHAPTAKEVWQHTEVKVRALKARADAAEAELLRLLGAGWEAGRDAAAALVVKIANEFGYDGLDAITYRNQIQAMVAPAEGAGPQPQEKEKL
jgi:hypothetical protein